MDWFTLSREILRGKSLGRTLINLRCREISLVGDGLDLGAKNGRASYYRFFSTRDAKLTFTDLHPREDGVLKIDLESGVPLPDDSQDFVILMNVMEHVYGYEKAVTECFRLLKPGGFLVGCVPFLVRVHPDPDDFFRFTQSSLDKVLRNAGFHDVIIEAHGFGPVSAALAQVVHLLKFATIRVAATWIGIALDGILNSLFANHPDVESSNYPLMYFFIATKQF